MLPTQCYLVSSTYLLRWVKLLMWSKDNGQGGAQGIEDGLALGLVLNGVTKVSQIGTRLEMYEKIRRNRASIVQILSNVGSDQDVPEEIIEFMEGNPLPSEFYYYLTSIPTLQRLLKTNFKLNRNCTRKSRTVLCSRHSKECCEAYDRIWSRLISILKSEFLGGSYKRTLSQEVGTSSSTTTPSWDKVSLDVSNYFSFLLY